MEIVFGSPRPEDIFADFFLYGPSINSHGQTAFKALLSGPDVNSTNRESVWSEGAGTLSLLARDGDAVPGFPVGTVYTPELDVPDFNGTPLPVILNDSGSILFDGKISGPGVSSVNDDVVWISTSGTQEASLREGTHPPGTSTGSTYGFRSGNITFLTVGTTLSDGGFSTFQALYIDGNSTVEGSSETGLWTSKSGQVDLIVDTTTHLPGTASGVTSLFGFGFSSGITGHTVFSTQLEGPAIDETNDAGIWSSNSGTLTAVVRDGDEAPGFPAGIALEGLEFTQPQVNSNSHIAFEGGLSGAGITDSNDSAIWEGIPGNFRLVSQEGDHAPGLPNEARLGSILSVLLNDSNEVAFEQDVVGTFSGCIGICSGIWSEGLGSLHLVARSGEQAPDLPSDVIFLQDDNFDGIGTFSFNSLGQVAFYGFLSGPGIDDTNDTGIWAEDINGQLKLIIREGDQIEVSPGDFRTVSLIRAELGESSTSGHANAFNDRGQIAFRATFTDGSEGIFVSNLVAIPEPSSVAILVCYMICSCSPRTRRT